jgi:molybdopterin converting factor small subunit
MSVSVQLFARARDLVGAAVLTVEMPLNATVGDLRRELGAEHPQLKSLLERSALAINDEFVDDPLVIPLNARIAILPPVSGG